MSRERRRDAHIVAEKTRRDRDEIQGGVDSSITTQIAKVGVNYKF